MAAPASRGGLGVKSKVWGSLITGPDMQSRRPRLPRAHSCRAHTGQARPGQARAVVPWLSSVPLPESSRPSPVLILGIATAFSCQSRGQRSATTQSQPHRRFFSRIMFIHLGCGTLWKKQNTTRLLSHCFSYLSYMMSAGSAAVCVMIRAFEALRSRITVSSFAASKSTVWS